MVGVSGSDIQRAAINLLARRDYSQQELRQKLSQKFSPTISSHEDYLEEEVSDHGVPPTDSEAVSLLIEQTLEWLRSENLQSDERYLESFINGRRAKGHGPHKIRQALRHKGIDDTLLERFLSEDEQDWVSLARQVYLKKFGDSSPEDYQDKARRLRFLQQRGFPHWVLEAIV